MTQGQQQRGFTLVEVLVAMAITAFISMVAYMSLSSVIAGAERLDYNADRSFAINRAWMMISRDLREFVPRSVRDEFGEVEPAMSGGENAPFMLSFTRAGWHNPNGHPRSNLQRVNYRVEDGALWRDAYYVLDRSADTEPESVKLLEDVNYMEVAFLGELQQLQFAGSTSNIDADNWADEWFRGSNTANNSPINPPLALSVTLELDDWGEMNRYYALPPL